MLYKLLNSEGSQNEKETSFEASLSEEGEN